MKKLIEKLIGRKYYIVVVFDGVRDLISSTPFERKADAIRFIKERAHLRTMKESKIISFRTKIRLAL